MATTAFFCTLGMVYLVLMGRKSPLGRDERNYIDTPVESPRKIVLLICIPALKTISAAVNVWFAGPLSALLFFY